MEKTRVRVLIRHVRNTTSTRSLSIFVPDDWQESSARLSQELWIDRKGWL